MQGVKSMIGFTHTLASLSISNIALLGALQVLRRIYEGPLTDHADYILAQ